MGKRDMPGAHDKPRVLVVDDSRVVRRVIIRILGRDFNILEAGDGVSAWRALQQNGRIDAVVTDIEMPEMNGYVLICKIRAAEDPTMSGLPIVVITGAEDAVTRERAYACGADDFILKPFDDEQLLGCLAKRLAARRAAAEGPVEPEPPQVPVPEPNVLPVVVSGLDAADVDEALDRIASGLELLAGMEARALRPRAVGLIEHLLPLLELCDRALGLGTSGELAALRQRLAAARGSAASAKTGSAS